MNLEDRTDLYELGKILLMDNEDKVLAAIVAMRKILDEESIKPIDYNPDIIVPPTTTILEYTGLKISELVSIDCWPRITEEMAYMLATITEYPAEFWLNLERNYQEKNQ